MTMQTGDKVTIRRGKLKGQEGEVMDLGRSGDEDIGEAGVPAD